MHSTRIHLELIFALEKSTPSEAQNLLKKVKTSSRSQMTLLLKHENKNMNFLGKAKMLAALRT